MKFDLAYVLVDLGEPWYKQAASEMIRSARRAYANHDMRVVQLSDRKTPICPDADGQFSFDVDVTKDWLCQFKGGAIASYALQADRPVIFCDVDVIWNKDTLFEELDGREGIFLLERDDMSSMPINAGLVVTWHRERLFWSAYRAACENLPAEVRGWWGDQFALTGTLVHLKGDAPVSLLRMDRIAPAIDALPGKPLDTPAVHFKGERKHLMLPYARMLDQGKGFQFVRPSIQRSEYFKEGFSF